MSLIRNERTKLLANALDRAFTACVVAGLIAPASAISARSNAAPDFSFGSSLGIVIWLSAALILHMLARRTLGALT
ncbi:hypothetical protein ABID16_001171 [Rhizobium aquaticum]|uniref:Uncharacterized protein n=1 Tax=Rhizobium aquaticum TaxID=1549636 RepID=A0ABV2IXN1_9HYPH